MQQRVWVCGVESRVHKFIVMKNEVNFIHVDVTLPYRELLMGPFESDDGPVIVFDDNHTMAHLMRMAGCFPSVTQARKNGWDIPIPPGYSEIRFGKNRLMIYILNKLTEQQKEEVNSVSEWIYRGVSTVG